MKTENKELSDRKMQFQVEEGSISIIGIMRSVDKQRMGIGYPTRLNFAASRFMTRVSFVTALQGWDLSRELGQKA